MNLFPLLYKHTKKAVRRGEPASRIFLVLRPLRDDEGPYLLAWKCTLTPQGLEHPAFPESPLPLTLEGLRRGLVERGENGSIPTATFFPEASLYETTTLQELRKRVRWNPNPIVVNIGGTPYTRAVDAFVEENPSLFHGTTNGEYLRNRLLEAFRQGWLRCESQVKIALQGE